MNNTYLCSTTLIKLSLLFQYLRVFGAGVLRYICIGFIIFTSIWGFTYSFFGWFPCFPVKGQWNRMIPAKCYLFGSKSPQMFASAYESHTAINMLLDLSILFIAMSIFKIVDLKKREFIALIALFNIGALLGAISIWRLVTIVRHRAGTYPILDFTWYAPISIILSALEVQIAIVLASIPIFWPVLVELGFGKILVVREIQVQTEHRQSDDNSSDYEVASVYSERDQMNKLDKQQSLERKTSSNLSQRHENHYNDEYTLDLVDPFSKSRNEVKVGRAQVPFNHLGRYCDKP
jgi:hypothetical protein